MNKQLSKLNQQQKKAKAAFTVADLMLSMMIIGILTACITFSLKPGELKEEAYKKSGSNMYYQLDYATKRLLVKNSRNYSMLSLIDESGNEFSITADGANTKLLELYKKYLKTLRNTPVPAEYLNLIIDDQEKTQTAKAIKISDFTQGYILKNGSYFALKLNKNCTTEETYVYDPSRMTKRNVEKSCGLIFYDVNSDNSPNVLGIDQYTIPLGKIGLK